MNITNIKIPVEISARHLHISKEDFEKLLGKNETLNSTKDLSQPGEFASDKLVTLVNGKNKIENVRILGPFREKSQVELSTTDAYTLKLNPFPKIRISGDLANTTKVLVKSKKASLQIPCIIAQRHLHLSKQEADKMNIKNNQKLKIQVKAQRPIIFEEVIARVSDKYKLAFHIDTDEGNSAGIFGKTFGEILR
jgi:putative phosphotransacetylase